MVDKVGDHGFDMAIKAELEKIRFYILGFLPYLK